MKSKKNSILLPFCAAIILIAGADARHGGHASSGSLYRPHRRSYDYHRRCRPNAIDLVSDMFSVPFYTSNSLFRQQQDQLARLEQNSAPRYSISQSEDGKLVELAMELPGVPAKDLSVEVEHRNVLRIRGSRTIRESGSVTKTEFDQSFQLDDDIDVENISVSLSSGILTITAPKKEPERKRIHLKIEERDSLLEKMNDESAGEHEIIVSDQEAATGSELTFETGNEQDFVITED